MTSKPTIKADAPVEGMAIMHHCERCNSELPKKHLLAKSWAGDKSLSCPNCGTPIVAQRAGGEFSGSVGYDFTIDGIDGIEGGELRICPHCRGAYRRFSANSATGEVQPVRFCPYCGKPVNARQ
ncbi:hypothetical protein BH23CHL4_BH23CHL4_11510 [soil metagenome]